MRAFTFAFLALVAAIITPAFIGPALAQNMASAAAEKSPLLVIRFNQPHVYFEQSLKTAVQRAVEVKPDVRFRLVQMLPDASNEDAHEAAKRDGQKHLASVVTALRNLRIPNERMQIIRQERPDVATDEVHIFVE